MPMISLVCPSCTTTDAVRAAVIGDGFCTTLALLHAPTVLVTVIAAYTYASGRARREPVR